MRRLFAAIVLTVGVLTLSESLHAAPPATQPVKPKFTIGKDTTFIVTPLRPDGTVDYVEAIDRRSAADIAPGQNAYAVLIRLADLSSLDEAERRTILAKLGVEPPDPADRLVSLQDFLASTRPDTPSDLPAALKLKATTRPWKEAEYPQVAAWLKANDRPLDLAVQAASRARYYRPSVGKDVVAIALPGLGAFVELSRALSARALLRAGRGDIDGAWHDLGAGMRIGRLMEADATLVGQLVGGLVEKNAVDSAKSLVSLPMTPQQAHTARKMLLDLPAHQVNPLPQALSAERFMALDIVQFMAASDDPLRELAVRTGGQADSQPDADPQRKPAKLDLDWDALLRQLNGCYDRLEEAARTPALKDRVAALDAVVKEHRIRVGASPLTREIVLGRALQDVTPESRAVLSRQLADCIASICMPFLSQVSIVSARVQTEGIVLQTAGALAAYRADTGKFPETLDALVPKYLPTVPPDAFDSQPLKYSRTADGFLLYSVGDNGKDEGGKTDRSAKPEVDDIAIRVPAGN